MDGQISTQLSAGPSSPDARDDARLPDEQAIPGTHRVRRVSIYWRVGNYVLAAVAVVVLALVVWNQY
jgi:hypothetical protein